MMTRPEKTEAAPYYFTYIDKVPDGDIVSILKSQLTEFADLLDGITEEKSLHRYAADKWSLREVLNHINDTERLFVYRAMWFARGFDSPLPSFDQNIAITGAEAGKIPWSGHVAEFRATRQSTIAFFQHMPDPAWLRSGIASGNPFTVRALAYMCAGHLTHHMAIVRERYL
jgi:hypothetical protein